MVVTAITIMLTNRALPFRRRSTRMGFWIVFIGLFGLEILEPDRFYWAGNIGKVNM